MSADWKRQRRLNSQFGFTLVELLVVISIIAVLLAILVPAMHKARLQSRRVICQTRIRSVHTAATLYAVDNGSVLPQGGYHLNGSDFDDAIGIDIKNFFRIASYVIRDKRLPIENIETLVVSSPGKVAPYAKMCGESTPGQIFVCPELHNSPRVYRDVYYRKNMPMSRVVYSSYDYVRTGFCYLAGFETDKWDYTGFKGLSNPNFEKWVSPRKTSDRGGLVLMTDRVRYVPAGEAWVNTNFIEVQHGSKGLFYKEPVGTDFDYRTVKGGTSICTLDGAIVHRPISTLKMRQFFNDTGSGGLNHQDYTFF